jgi:phosphopantetheine adenylyltransferase
MDEIEYLHKEFGITYFSFEDDLLMTSVEHTEQVCQVFAKRRKKGLRDDQVIKVIEATYEAGISPSLNMIFGNIADTKETLKKISRLVAEVW